MATFSFIRALGTCRHLAVQSITGTAGTGSPWSVIYGTAICCMLMGKQGGSELQGLRWGDIKISIHDGHQFLTWCMERFSNSRNGSKPKSMKNGVPKLAALLDPKHKKRCPVNVFLTFSKHRTEDQKRPESPSIPVS